jgi:hypothetical protein
MTIVVSAWRVTELMNLEVFKVVRKDHENRTGSAARRRPQPESVAVPTTAPTTDENV